MAEPHSAAVSNSPSDETAAPSSSQIQSRSPNDGTVTVARTSWILADTSSIVRDDTWSCFAVVFSFWFFVSVTLILGVYGSTSFVLGPASSMVFQPSPLFVQYVKVENLEAKPGPILYGTYKDPPVDIVRTWTQTLNVSIPSDSHQEWKYYLNRGSQVNISYHLRSESSSVFLVIAEGTEGLNQWLEDPTYPNTTLSWNVIHGTGMITQEIYRSSSYYVALGNLDVEVEVELNLSVRAYFHNTTDAYYKCAVTNSPCSLNIIFPNGNAAVLVTPVPQQNTSNDAWYIKLSYGPRWVTYIFGTGGLTLLMFWAFNYLNKLQCANEDRVGGSSERTESQRAPLLSRKDDDLSSWGSSCDSLSQGEADLDFLTGDSTDGKILGEGETSNNTRRLCAICFDAPRDCFFLPCGHCVACFECGTRLAEAAGTCPVCNKKMKKVRKIFTV